MTAEDIAPVTAAVRESHDDPHAVDADSKGEQHTRDEATPNITNLSVNQKEPTISKDNQASQLQAETAGASVHLDIVPDDPHNSILDVSRSSNKDKKTSIIDV
jgi:hypothetical protein